MALRLALHERTKADTLHSARNQPAPRRPCLPDRLSVDLLRVMPQSPTAAASDSIAFFTAAHRLCSWNGFVISAKPFSTTYRCTTCRSS